MCSLYGKYLYTIWMVVCILCIYCIVGKFGSNNVWRTNRLTRRLLIVTTNLDGFSLVNDWFTKFAKISLHQTFSLYNKPTFLMPDHYFFNNHYYYICISTRLTTLYQNMYDRTMGKNIYTCNLHRWKHHSTHKYALALSAYTYYSGVRSRTTANTQ